MQCYKQATAWEPGTKRPEHPLHDVFRLFDVEFEDTEDTVIIIDEIQESWEVYNRIRGIYPPVPGTLYRDRKLSGENL